MKLGTRCTQSPRMLKKKCAGWWGPEYICKNGEDSVVMLAQVNDEEKLMAHMTLVTETAGKMGMQHTIYKFMHDSS